MPMTLPPAPGAPQPRTPFRTYTDEINGESHTNPQNNVYGVSEGVPNHIGNGALYKHTLSAVDRYANIQIDESSSSSEDISPVLVTPEYPIGNEANGQNDNRNLNYNANVNGFDAGSNANYYDQNK
eukprot:722125_1